MEGSIGPQRREELAQGLPYIGQIRTPSARKPLFQGYLRFLEAKKSLILATAALTREAALLDFAGRF
jgi:hypothetical protein